MPASKVQLTIEEPWEFGVENSEGPHDAEIVQRGDGLLLLRMAKPVVFEGVTLEYLMAGSRYQGDDVTRLRSHGAMTVHLVPVDPESVDIGRGFEAGLAWRGWHLIATLRRR